MTSKIKWGIIGPGKIANKFAEDLMLSQEGELFAVASRDIDKARAFAQKYHASKWFGSYLEMLKSPEIDVVYVATPHPFHFENTMSCLQNGKPVLCEKPMGMGRGEVERMVQEARARNLFLMEGLWTRFIPGAEKALELIENGMIGDLQFIRADFGFTGDPNPEGRLFNKKLGGGSLLDIGIYPIYLSLLTLGVPSEIKAMSRMTSTGVDSYCSMLFGYENGAKAILESTVEADTPIEGLIYGSKGYLKLHRRFHHPDRISVHLLDGEEIVFEVKYSGNGYLHEIEEVHHCLLNNQKESQKLPLDTSLNLITIIDRVKEEIGLHYEGKA
jgi:predicted dehydrogenase